MRMNVLLEKGTWKPDMPTEIKGIVSSENPVLVGLWQNSSTRDYHRSYETVEVINNRKELEKIL